MINIRYNYVDINKKKVKSRQTYNGTKTTNLNKHKMIIFERYILVHKTLKVVMILKRVFGDKLQQQ